jgi:hypothetical protein
MGKRVESVSNEMLLGAGVHLLDPQTRILARQAGMLLSRGKTRMDSDRRDSKPPPACKDGGKITYPLGGVLAERARQHGQTLAEVAKERADAIRGWPTFAGFLAIATLHDTWPIATLDGRPVDALSTLGQPVSGIEDMELGTYLERALAFAQKRDQEVVDAILEKRVQKAPEPPPICVQCGRDAHAGWCRA